MLFLHHIHNHHFHHHTLKRENYDDHDCRYALPNPDHPPPTQGWILPYPPSRPPQGSVTISFRSRWLMLCRSKLLVFNVMDVTRPAKYPDLPPPSYDESMFGPTNVKEEVGPKPPKMVVISLYCIQSRAGWLNLYFCKLKTFKIECLIQDDGEHTRGDWNFLPKYPRYITKYWYRNPRLQNTVCAVYFDWQRKCYRLW